MISQRVFNQMSLIMVGIMLVMLLLVIFKVVPVTWYWPLFSVVLVLFLIRTTLRLVLARQARLDRERGKLETQPPEDKPAG
jgi:hypothetical protein